MMRFAEWIAQTADRLGLSRGPVAVEDDLAEYQRREWAKLDDDLRRQIVRVLREDGWFPTWAPKVRAEYKKDPDGWFLNYHFGWGMTMRNYLRQHGIPDSFLLTGNWDDYWVQAVEHAAIQG